MLFLNGKPVNTTIFPDNTSQVWKLDEGLFDPIINTVRWEYSNEADIMQLAQLKTLLDHKKLDSILIIEYLPYARQDKLVSNDSTFAFFTFRTILNAMNFSKVFVVDPHNTGEIDLIDRCSAIYPKTELIKAIEDLRDEPIVICYPDKNAYKKYSVYYSSVTVGIPIIYCEKKRNQSTGAIESIELKTTSFGEELDPIVYGSNILIVDDICDGGATFIEVAKLLRNEDAESVSLYTTHGIYSKGIRHLKRNGIDNIYNKKGRIG